jgi:trimethylamine monooxygenase
MGWHWPDNFSTVPLLTHVEGKMAFFKDGTSKQVDAIILCTGYKHHFPYLEEKLNLKTLNRLWPNDLHKGIFLKSNHKMMFLGMQDQWFTFNMFDAQAWCARDVILGSTTLPDNATLDKEFDEWRAREETLEGDEANIRFQADYVSSLIGLSDYPMFDIESVVQLFLDWEHNKHEDIMTFRDKAHKSVKTGTVAPVHHTTWLKALDDSMACYLDTEKKAAQDA